MVIIDERVVVIVFSLPIYFCQFFVEVTLETGLEILGASLENESVDVFENSVAVLPHIVLFGVRKGLVPNVNVFLICFLVGDIDEIGVLVFVGAVVNELVEVVSEEVEKTLHFSFAVVGFAELERARNGLLVAVL